MTDKDLQRLYVSAKIKYNPLEYTLSDKVIMSVDDLPTIANFDYESEGKLLNKICEKTSLHIGIESYSKDSVYSSFFKEPGKPTGIITCISTGTLDDFKLLMNYRNNLSIEEAALKNLVCVIVDGSIYSKRSLRDREYIDDLIEHGNYLESLITLNIALRDSSSILPILKLAEFPEYLSYSYEDLLNGKYILDYLGDGKITNLPIAFTDLRDSITCAIANQEHYPGLDKDKAEYLLKVSCFNTILYGIEILHAIESIKDDKLKISLHYMLTKGYDSEGIASLLYTVKGKDIVINEDIQKIIDISDNRKRFKELCLHMCSTKLLNEISDLGKAIITDSNLAAPIFLALMVIFGMEYSLQSVRTKNIMVLLAYMKSNGIKLDSSTSSEVSDALEDFGMDDSEDDEDKDDEDEDDDSYVDDSKSKDSLIDFHDDHSSGTGLPGIESKFKKTPALQSLDEAVSSFSDDMFKYDVKDVIDVSDKYKSKYNAIVENVSLLNKTLIKRIKEIKVYNEGGKNPGLSSGKLDMKNIHKYRTTDKIFCKNTYKIKESDLAFGIILDVSGSMHGNGIKNGVITMIILHETLKALNINHSIITHTEHKGYHTCDIKRYQNFREQATYSVRKNYALAGIVAESGNCDAAALKYMETAFRKVRNKDKICLIFSDGEPTECSDAELLKQIKHMENNGIKTIGIGVNFSNIKEYYKDNANGKNLKDMLDIVSNILKQYILDKKE